MPETIILELEKLAESLSLAYNNLTAENDAIDDEIKEVIKKHRAKLRLLTRIVKEKEINLIDAIKKNKDFFKEPKTRTMHGITFGMTKDQDKLDYPEDQILVASIEKEFPDKTTTLIKTEKTPIKGTIKKLSADDLEKLGITEIKGKDSPYIKAIKSDLGKLVLSVIAEILKEEKINK